MKLNFLLRFFSILFALFFIINTVHSINYFPSEGIFEVQVNQVYDTGNYSYVIDYDITNTVNPKLDYTAEVIYKLENLISGYDEIKCYNNGCSQITAVERLFFGDYNLVLTTKFNGRYYQEIIPFSISLEQLSYDILIDDKYYIQNGSLVISGAISSQINDNVPYTFEIFPKSSPQTKYIFNKNCFYSCNFDFEISSPVIIDDYLVNIYSPYGDMQKNFTALYPAQSEFVDFIQNNGAENATDYFLYNNNNTKTNATISVKSAGQEVNLVDINPSQSYDIEFDFKHSSVKKIKIANADIDEVSIGYEEIPVESVPLLNTVENAFAINPIFSNPTNTYSLTFVASGYSLLKCEQYNFTTQTCYGDYKKILDTIPGREYTIELMGVDPQFVEISDYVLSPTGASCQDIGGGWAASNCDDTSYTGATFCPAGGSGEYTYCNDTYVETHTMERNADGGVRMFFEDTSQSKCEVVTKVEIVYNTWFAGPDTKGTQTISFDADGDGWTAASVTIDYSDPGSDRVVDVTNSLPAGEYWNCSDFFQSNSTVGIEALYGGSGASNNQVYTLNVDTLVYRVTYNYTLDPFDIDKIEYVQGDTIYITGSETWSPSSTVYVNLTLPNGTIHQLPNQIPDVNSSFSETYDLGDYYPLGEYTFFVIQGNDSSLNDTHMFNLTKRNPLINSQNYYANRGDTLNFVGNTWAKSETVIFSYTDPLGNFTYNDSQITTTSLGTFNFNYTFLDTNYVLTGAYLFNFTELINSTYVQTDLVEVIFRPNQTTGVLSDINDTDTFTYNVGGGPQNDNIDIQFPDLIPTGYKADSMVVYLEYDTVGTGVSRQLRWYNDTSATYQTVCTYPDSASETMITCNITNYANYNYDFDNLTLNLFEDGKNSDNWNIDFIYIHRNFSIEPLIVNNDIQLKINKSITRLADNNFSIYIELYNLNSADVTPANRDLFVYMYLHNLYNLTSSFVYSPSSWYLVDESNETLNGLVYNGTIYRFNLSENNIANAVFTEYTGTKTSENSWSVTFNVTGFGNYNYGNLALVGIDPILNKKEDIFFNNYEVDFLCR